MPVAHAPAHARAYADADGNTNSDSYRDGGANEYAYRDANGHGNAGAADGYTNGDDDAGAASDQQPNAQADENAVARPDMDASTGGNAYPAAARTAEGGR